MSTKHRINAWLLGNIYGPADLIKAGPKAAELVAYSNADMTKSGWTKVGHADIELHLVSTDEMIESKVESLRVELQQTRAEAEAKATRITRQINELLALPLSAEVTS